MYCRWKNETKKAARHFLCVEISSSSWSHPKARRLLKKWVDILGNMLQSVSLCLSGCQANSRNSASLSAPLQKDSGKQAKLECEKRRRRSGWEWKRFCLLGHLLALQRPLEEAQEGGQAEAVHVVDLRQVGDDKIHLAGALGQRQVGIPLLEWS